MASDKTARLLLAFNAGRYPMEITGYKLFLTYAKRASCFSSCGLRFFSSSFSAPFPPQERRPLVPALFPLTLPLLNPQAGFSKPAVIALSPLCPQS